MHTIETKVFSYNELGSSAQDRVFQRWQEAQNEYCLEGTQDDMLASLKGICACLGYGLRDWTFGAYCQGWKARATGGETIDLSGPRAMAYVLRCLMCAGYDRPRHFKDMAFPGQCGFTGMCYDDDLAQSLWEDLLAGETIAKAIDGLACKLCRMCEDELEYLTSKDCFLETLEMDVEMYDEEGGEA